MREDVAPFYGRGIWLKNRFDTLLKPTMGKIYDKNAPGYSRNDIVIIVRAGAVWSGVGTLAVALAEVKCHGGTAPCTWTFKLPW
jgi:hypothetical protein